MAEDGDESPLKTESVMCHWHFPRRVIVSMRIAGS
jgi:hypothetical protein